MPKSYTPALDSATLSSMTHLLAGCASGLDTLCAKNPVRASAFLQAPLKAIFSDLRKNVSSSEAATATNACIAILQAHAAISAMLSFSETKHLTLAALQAALYLAECRPSMREALNQTLTCTLSLLTAPTQN